MMSSAKPDSGPTDKAWKPVCFERLHGWHLDDHRAAFEVFKSSARHLADSGKSTVLTQAFNQALALENPDPDQARRFFENRFIPHKYSDEGDKSGLVTAYFEPEVEASRTSSGKFCIPLYRRPSDLVEVTPTNRPAGMTDTMGFGRIGENGMEPYFDRKAIQSGALHLRGLELAWLKDKTEAFFVHVQGSARLLLPDGEIMHITYAAKSGHPYTSIGRILADRLGIPAKDMTADILADWMRHHPKDIDELMAQNNSYIFFKEVNTLDHNAGPIGAVGVPLAPGRSLAVDFRHHAYGLPIWVDVPDAKIGGADGGCENGDASLRRLMIAQDTGSAIVGPQRGDIFVGSGHHAGFLAGKVRSKATFHTLVPTP